MKKLSIAIARILYFNYAAISGSTYNAESSVNGVAGIIS